MFLKCSDNFEIFRLLTIGFIVLLCASTIRYVCAAEAHDQKTHTSRHGVEWEDLNPDCVDYLNAILNYPVWRVCFLASVISLVSSLGAHVLIHDTLNLKQLGLFIIIHLLLTLTVTNKLMNYFRWHIMCQGDKGWGCMQRKKVRKEARTAQCTAQKKEKKDEKNVDHPQQDDAVRVQAYA